MKVSVLVPFTPGTCTWRDAAWGWVKDRYMAEFPDWEIVLGTSPPGPYSRTGAIRDAMAKSSGSVFVIPDGDVWTDGLPEAVERAIKHGWAIPHRLIHRLSPESTWNVLGGADWRGLPLSEDNAQDRKPYIGHEAGTMLVATREALEIAPPDPRFRGWGSEDDAWSHALRTLVGKPWRGKADLYHLFHPPQERINRRVGTKENVALLRRYQNARNRPNQMRKLIAEFTETSAE